MVLGRTLLGVGFERKTVSVFGSRMCSVYVGTPVSFKLWLSIECTIWGGFLHLG